MIETVKIQGDGYLVNGTMSVPKSDGNKDYEAVKKWIADGNIVGAEFSQADLLQQAKDTKLGDIQKDFETAENTPVSYGGFQFFGGDESGTSIDKYIRMMQLAGATEFNIWDINGVEHTYTLSQAQECLLAIATQASINKFTKKNRKVALAKAELISEVEAV